MGETSREEIAAKMSMDTEPFSRAINKSKSSMAEFAESGKSGFVRAEEGGRQFHKLIEKITEQSPMMGNALKLAISPIAGTIALASAGMAYFQKQLASLNEVLDRFGSTNAKRIGDAKAVKDAVQSGMKKEQQSFTDFEESTAEDPAKWLADTVRPGHETRAIDLIDQARKKVGARLLDYDSGKGAKEREKRKTSLGKAKSEMEDLRAQLKEYEALRDSTQDAADFVQKYLVGGGKRALGGVIDDFIYSPDKHKAMKNAEAQIMIGKIKGGIAQRESLIKGLQPAEEFATEQQARDRSEFQGLNTARARVVSDMMSRLHGTVGKGVDESMKQTEQILNGIFGALVHGGIKIQLPDD